jgi:hypothetical protein
MRPRVAASAACAALLLICAAAEAGDAPSFKKDVQPILNAQCVFCHVTGAENGGLNLGGRKAYAALTSPSTESALARVAPGNPDKSYLVHKLRGTQLTVGGSGLRMPMTDPPTPIDAGQLDLIVKWIAAGAPDN